MSLQSLVRWLFRFSQDFLLFAASTNLDDDLGTAADDVSPTSGVDIKTPSLAPISVGDGRTLHISLPKPHFSVGAASPAATAGLASPDQQSALALALSAAETTPPAGASTPTVVSGDSKSSYRSDDVLLQPNLFPVARKFALPVMPRLSSGGGRSGGSDFRVASPSSGSL